jgi:pullulanase
MNIIRDEVNKIDPTIFIYGEGWSAGECAYPAEKLERRLTRRGSTV